MARRKRSWSRVQQPLLGPCKCAPACTATPDASADLVTATHDDERATGGMGIGQCTVYTADAGARRQVVSSEGKLGVEPAVLRGWN